MAKNPFSPDSFEPQKLRRTPRDLSHRKIFTTEFGKGMPVLAQEVFPGDTIKIENVDLAIQGMPTYFPLTSRLKVSVSYFLCRNRCVDESWEDFIFNTKTVDKAWLRMDNTRAKKMISTGSLGDMFGLPTTVGAKGSFSFPSFFSVRSHCYAYTVPFGDLPVVPSSDLLSVRLEDCTRITGVYPLLSSIENTSYLLFVNEKGFVDDGSNYDLVKGSSKFVFSLSHPLNESISTTRSFVFALDGSRVVAYDSLNCVALGSSYTSDVFSDSFINIYNSLDPVTRRLGFGICPNDSPAFYGVDEHVYYTEQPYRSLSYLTYVSSVVVTSSRVIDATDDTVISDNLFVGNNPVIPVEAHIFRHYTMVGNYYYRNDRNNPYIIDGVPEYNKFIPSKASGPDDNVYDYFYRNWELDRFTGMTQTPQVGDAPLVGLTFNPKLSSSVLTFQATDAEGVSHDYKVTVGVDREYNLESIANFDKDIPSSVLRHVTDMIAYGTSINNIRVTNSFQRFLERAQHGLRYRHQMKSHLGVSVDYPDIDIPQYIGGFNGEINSVRNENMAASEYANLGDFNGSLFANISSKHPITVQVPEHGYILGIMTIVPVPIYPQSVTNKALIKRSPFEYPLQEFMRTGNEPVFYKEFMPLQTGADQSVDDVAGYRRPYAEYLNNLDEAHGDFRTTLKDFACMRMFAERPELSEEFTTVHPEELNQIFISENIADKYGSNSKFLCRIDYKMSGLRQIPDDMPSLE